MATSAPTFVARALAGKRVLITGTSGFLAKVVLEKLIREVPDVGAIVLLLRGSRDNPTSQQRFEREVLTSSIFDVLRQRNAEGLQAFCEQRIHCVTGEVTQPRLGLSEREFNLLASRIDVIINAAASVNFREELDQALEINTLSVIHLAELARLAGDIPLVQVSTCYVNGFNSGAMHEELVHPTGLPIPYNQEGFYEVERLIGQLQEKISAVRTKWGDTDRLSEKLIDLGIKEANAYGWNDTYTFTKWLGEQVALKATRRSTLTILRPSIIESTLFEPSPGCVEGVKVADAIILAYAREKVRFFPAKTDEVIDIIPADLVANSVLLSAAEALLEPGRQRIYQCCSGSRNPIQLGQLIDLLQDEARRNWQRYDRLFFKAPSRPFRTTSRTVFLAGLAAAKAALTVFDAARKLVGVKTPLRAFESLKATQGLAVVFSFYTSPSYCFYNSKLLALAARVGESGKGRFPVDSALIDWKHYLGDVHMAGLNRYALKERRKPVAETATVAQAALNPAEASSS